MGKIENLAETNVVEIFGGARQILSPQWAGVLFQMSYLLFYQEHGIIWLVPGVTVARRGPEVFLQTTLNFIMVQWDCGPHLWTLISMVGEKFKMMKKRKRKKNHCHTLVYQLLGYYLRNFFTAPRYSFKTRPFWVRVITYGLRKGVWGRDRRISPILLCNIFMIPTLPSLIGN